MTSIAESAEKYITSYGGLIDSGKAINDLATAEEQDKALDEHCKKILAWRLPGSVAFGIPGSPPQQQSDESVGTLMKAMFANCIKHHIAAGLTLKDYKVKVLYDFGGHGAAMIDVTYTWEALPKSGIKPWDVKTYYGYRKMPSGDEGWEYAYADEDFSKIMENVGPKFFEGMAPLAG